MRMLAPLAILVALGCAVGLPELDPAGTGLGVKVTSSGRLSILPANRPHEVYFAGFGEEAEPYVANGALRRNYSRLERRALRQLPLATYTSATVGSAHYLLNVPPGRYVVIGGELPQQQNHGGAVGPGVSISVKPPPLKFFLSAEALAFTEVHVTRGNMAFMGEVECSQRWWPDEAQLDYAGRIRGRVEDWQKGRSLGEVVKGALFSVPAALAGEADILTWCGIESFARASGDQSEFWSGVESDFRNDSAWQERARQSSMRETPAIDINASDGLDEEAGRLFVRGEVEQAISAAEQALAAGESELPEGSPRLAALVTNLADIHWSRRNYIPAGALYQRALGIRVRALGSKHPSVAFSRAALARIARARGDTDAAVEAFERVLALREQSLGRDHRHIASALVELAETVHIRGEGQRALELLSRAEAILRVTNDAALTDVLVGRAAVLRSQGNDTEAEKFLRIALIEQREFYGDTHPRVADTASSLATLLRESDRAEQALPLVNTSLAIRRESFGEKHPKVADSLIDLALVYERMPTHRSRIPQVLEQALEIREDELQLVLATGSEAQKILFSANMSRETSLVLSLHLFSAPLDPVMAELAFSTVLRRKGRVLDATAESVRAARSGTDPVARQNLAALTKARARLAALTFRRDAGLPAKAQARLLDEASQAVDRMEASLGGSGVSSTAPDTKPSGELARLRGRLSAGAALVEIARIEPYRFGAGGTEVRWAPSRYAAYILERDGALQWLDLGDATEIDREIDKLRNTIGNASDAYRSSAMSLEQRLLAPIRRLVGATHLLIAPDGELSLVPFSILLNQAGQHAIEQFTFTSLSSGRDLLRAHAARSERTQVIVIAAPDFDLANIPDDSKLLGGSRSPKQSSVLGIDFAPLPGTASEARALRAILPQATVLMGANATETALKAVSGPRLLHVATHGFFLADAAPSFGRQRGIAYPTDPSDFATPIEIEEPLLRSGLALAGANRAASSADDGILTALEASGLDLTGTELVVLSACETGVGKASSGEGVFGLRRALASAGAESQLMSLWKIDDAATADMMVGYYERLLSGHGRASSLRETQLEMLGSKQHRHPYFWGAFIQIGDWRPLASTPAGPNLH